MGETLNWLLPRILLALAGVVVGALVFWWAGQMLTTPMLTVALGLMVGVGFIFIVDTWRAHRLLGWLRGPMQDTAPRDAGLYGEMAYRIERAVRARDRGIAQQQRQLTDFLTAIEASPNGVLMIDANEQILWCNHLAATHFCLDPERDLQQRITNLVRAPGFVGYLQAGAYAEPLTLANQRGGGRQTLLVIVRSYGEGMKLIITQDVTERERADAMRRDFVANVSHEIRTPLTVLSGFIETLSSLPLTEVERGRVLVLMEQQTSRMQTLVSDLLTLAQLEGSPRPGTDRWLPLDPLLSRLIGEATMLSAGRHRITGPEATHLELAGTETEMISAAGNLLSNAVRYTPAGGAIRLDWRLLPDGSGEISVADTGPGIAREHIPRLTERFYRVDGSRSRETGGTGLGLSIVKHVMQRHGGELRVESEPGQGSRFALVLPAARLRSTEPAHAA
ncbi:phosphate regulon sensor histidine kinase PhoR [Burkholderiaceae bacterium UC74_6]